MDATDHENIPYPGENSGLSSWMHIGFDYLKHEVENQRKPGHLLSQGFGNNKNKLEKVTTAVKKQSMPESYVSASQENLKMNHCKNGKVLKYTNEDSGLESASSTNSSPAASPQGSPSTKRRQDYNMLASNAQAVPCYNPITWIYKGFFSQESELPNPARNVTCVHKDNTGGGNKRSKKSLPSDSGRRKYIITNFDINALSPQSW